jgi:hypothetical protein
LAIDKVRRLFREACAEKCLPKNVFLSSLRQAVGRTVFLPKKSGFSQRKVKAESPVFAEKSESQSFENFEFEDINN